MSGWSAEPSTQAQCGQALSVASMMRSGCSLSARLTPGRPPRRDFTRSGRFAFWPFEGGVLELSGVLGGALSLASNSAIRAINEVICAVCASI